VSRDLDDHAVARTVAEAAARLLLELRGSPPAGGNPQHLRDEGDRRAQSLIAQLLADVRPGEAILSEEAIDDGARLSRSRVWIIDPLDGTREFGEPPRTDWAVHVALCVDGVPTAGAVSLPAHRRAPRRWPSWPAMPTSTCTPAASTSGTRQRRSLSLWAPGCTPRV